MTSLFTLSIKGAFHRRKRVKYFMCHDARNRRRPLNQSNLKIRMRWLNEWMHAIDADDATNDWLNEMRAIECWVNPASLWIWWYWFSIPHNDWLCKEFSQHTLLHYDEWALFSAQKLMKHSSPKPKKAQQWSKKQMVHHWPQSVTDQVCKGFWPWIS